MGLLKPKALTVRLAEGRPVIEDVFAAAVPERFRAKPKIDPARCRAGCAACAAACPAEAIAVEPLKIDLGACVFCGRCAEACPEGAVTFTNDYRIAATSREGLWMDGSREEVTPEACSAEIKSLFGRSLKLRSISAGGCNGCEMELNALSNINFDLGRFGVEFVASPRHADGVVISGTTTRAMEHALEATIEAVPAPRLVILYGACAISGGVFKESGQLARAGLGKYKADLYLPGCPPHPLTFITGLLTYLRRANA